MLHLISAIVSTLVLTLSPTTGKAPLTVSGNVVVAGPASGAVCLAFTTVDAPTEVVLIPSSCSPVDVKAGQTTTVTIDRLSGGVPNQKYNFKAVLVNPETRGPENRSVVAESAPVVITTTE